MGKYLTYICGETGVDNLFRTADRFQPDIILRTGSQ